MTGKHEAPDAIVNEVEFTLLMEEARILADRLENWHQLKYQDVVPERCVCLYSDSIRFLRRLTEVAGR